MPRISVVLGIILAIIILVALVSLALGVIVPAGKGFESKCLAQRTSCLAGVASKCFGVTEKTTKECTDEERAACNNRYEICIQTEGAVTLPPPGAEPTARACTSVSLSLTPDTTTPDDSIELAAKATGAGCDKVKVKISSPITAEQTGSFSGDTYTTTWSSARYPAGTYTFTICTDKDDNGKYGESGEPCATAKLTSKTEFCDLGIVTSTQKSVSATCTIPANKATDTAKVTINAAGFNWLVTLTKLSSSPVQIECTKGLVCPRVGYTESSKNLGTVSANTVIEFKITKQEASAAARVTIGIGVS